MADECDVSTIVTTFLLNTCRLAPRLSRYGVRDAVTCARVATEVSPVSDGFSDGEAVIIPLITGSVAEFYIEPILPHVGDIDAMCHLNTMLAIPRGHLPPTPVA